MRSHCTVTVTDLVLRPYWLVTTNMYLVVEEGMTTMLFPRTVPTCGVTMV